MINDINFLSKQKKQLETRDQSDKKSFFLVLALIVVVGLIFAAIWSVNRWYQSQIASVESQKSQIENRILQNKNQETDYLVFYEKVKKLTELIEKRTHGTQSLVDTYDYFTTQETAVVSSTYDYYTKNLELVIASNSVFSLPQLLEMVQSSRFTSDYKGMELLSLNRTDTGIYRLRVNLEL